MRLRLSVCICAIIALNLISACREKTTQSTNQSNGLAPSSSNLTPLWFFNEKEDTLGNPQTKLFLVLKDTIKITDATASFRITEKTEYSDRKMPTNTLIACTGFWAGLEQQYIVVDSSDFWVVKAKFEDEGNEKPEEFETIKIIKK